VDVGIEPIPPHQSCREHRPSGDRQQVLDRVAAHETQGMEDGAVVQFGDFGERVESDRDAECRADWLR
jgi:hypothetical protein